MILGLICSSACLAGAFAYAGRVRTWWHPMVGYLALWSLLLLIVALNPLGLSPLSSSAAVIIATGIGAAVAGSALVGALAPGSPAARRSSVVFPHTKRVLTAAVGIFALVGVGAFALRHQVEAAAGVPFSALSLREVRFVTVYQGAGGGIAALALACAPIASCLGVVLARQRVWGWLFVVGPIAATTITPGRSVTVTALAITVVFWLYHRREGRPATRRRPARAKLRAAVLVAVAIGASVAYFQYVGEALNKNVLVTRKTSQSHIPRALVPITVYFTASPAALSEALDERVNPTDGHHRSVWLLPRLAAFVDPAIRVPDTLAGFVPIPFSFNTYTWAGDAWFDFGIVGVVILGLLMGYVATAADARARRLPSLTTAWVAAVLVTLMFWSVIAYRFFWLETAEWLVLGTLVLRLCEDRQREGSRVTSPALQLPGQRLPT